MPPAVSEIQLNVEPVAYLQSVATDPGMAVYPAKSPLNEQDLLSPLQSSSFLVPAGLQGAEGLTTLRGYPVSLSDPLFRQSFIKLYDALISPFDSVNTANELS